jgi:putative transposase
MTTARKLLKQTLESFESKASKAMGVLESGFDDAIAVIELPEKLRRRLRTTNSVERLNEEIRRRERVIRIFPNRDSVIRLIGAFLLDQHENWISGKKYLDMAEYKQWKEKEDGEESKSSHVA